MLGDKAVAKTMKKLGFQLSSDGAIKHERQKDSKRNWLSSFGKASAGGRTEESAVLKMKAIWRAV